MQRCQASTPCETSSESTSAQILLGFQFNAPFQNAFGQLSPLEKKIEIVVLGTIMIVVGLLIAPSARHRILEQGEATPSINDYISRIAMATLVPFALVLSQTFLA
jgi:hypothetical protein